ncbi:MAG: type II toxin-antitoxin system antitoxin SocA domain-containing protein [Pseudomonadota bacterium]
MKALEVAKYILVKANFDGESITNLKMQKLLYYAQAWYLVNYSQPLFDEQIKAWKFGPIIESIYHHFKRFRYSPIQFLNKENIEEKISQKEKMYLDEFYSIFIRYSASDLTQLSHNEAPWKNTSQGETIPQDTIKNFYKGQLKKYSEQTKKT